MFTKAKKNIIIGNINQELFGKWRQDIITFICPTCQCRSVTYKLTNIKKAHVNDETDHVIDYELHCNRCHAVSQYTHSLKSLAECKKSQQQSIIENFWKIVGSGRINIKIIDV